MNIIYGSKFPVQKINMSNSYSKNDDNYFDASSFNTCTYIYTTRRMN